MGGKILEYEAKNILNKGVDMVTKMNAWLSDSNRTDDLIRSFKDNAFQQKLLAEYQQSHPTSTSM